MNSWISLFLFCMKITDHWWEKITSSPLVFSPFGCVDLRSGFGLRELFVRSPNKFKHTHTHTHVCIQTLTDQAQNFRFFDLGFFDFLDFSFFEFRLFESRFFESRFLDLRFFDLDFFLIFDFQIFDFFIFDSWILDF